MLTALVHFKTLKIKVAVEPGSKTLIVSAVQNHLRRFKTYHVTPFPGQLIRKG